MTGVEAREYTVLIMTPVGGDARLAAEVLAEQKIQTQICNDLGDLERHLRESWGAVLVAQEALAESGILELNRILSKQPPWSDIPILLLVSERPQDSMSLKLWSRFAETGFVTILHRPLRKATLVNAVRVALRSRSRQYEVRKLLEEYRSATLLRDEFISIASHELKTPITGLKLRVQVSQRALQASITDGVEEIREKFANFISATDKSLGRLVRLIDDMLDVTRIQSGKLTLNPEKVAVDGLVRDVFEQFSSQLREAGCEVHLDLEEGAEGVWDRYRMEQVISNLVTNILRYARGQPVHVRLEKLIGGARLVVQDHGPGIKPEHLEKIFQRFERPGASQSISGLGLGLFICRQIVNLHGGRIWAESAPGQGVRFIIELPDRIIPKQAWAA